MKKRLLNKAVSLTAAAALSCTSMLSSGWNFIASADDEQVEVSTELVSVIVKVSGDAVLTTPEGVEQGSEFLTTDRAVQISDTLKGTQSYVQDEIRQLYPEMQVGYSYSVLYNGFSCEIPENLIDEVRNLPFVENVAISQETTVPKMATSPSLGEIPAYYDATGCYGEGKVIAVIDSELDYTHPMFSALDESLEVAITQEDIAAIASGIGFNVDIDPARAYVNSKIPYAIDYIDDPYDGLPSAQNYHGTHVSGIAAGNEFVDENGQVVSGIAKNAQIVFMAAGLEEGGLPDDAILASMEDAVKLKADVINMSLGSNGEYYGSDPLSEAYIAAENAGVVICKASGNEGDGDTLNFTENPDTSMTDMIEPGTKVFTVASAGNEYTEQLHAFRAGDTLIAMEACINDIDIDGYFLDDKLSGEYEYVFCGFGTEEDFANLDLTGKIALVNQGGDLYLVDRAENAGRAGAVGVIGIAEKGTVASGRWVDSETPATVINYEDGQKMIEAEEKILSFTGERISRDVATAVSDFSSWGVKQSLEIEPDIMGIGGHVYSAGYDGAMHYMDGTSMATPYLSGCVAVMSEYMDKRGIQLEGTEKISYIRNLLMNSAALYLDEDGLYISPRQQGAGLVNLNHMIEDKVIMTNLENDAKINLYDQIGSAFGFDVNLTNLSDEDVQFSSAKLVLTTSNYYYDEELERYCIDSGKQIGLECSADVSALTSIAAGESRTEHVSVSLNAEQLASINEIYTNGFFVEGYLVLEGAENNCDISIPVLGFYGDWAQVPIWEEESSGVLLMGNTTVNGGFSMANRTKVLQEVLAQIPEEELETEDIESLFYTYATDEQVEAFWAWDDFYISPNGDGLADKFGISATNIRFCDVDGLTYYNEAGEVVAAGEYVMYPNRVKGLTWTYTSNETDKLEDGIYTAEISGVIDYASSYEDPQVIYCQVTVDNTAPELQTEIREENGRQILKLTASDANLDGIYISGTGTGGVYGVYDADNAQTNGLDAFWNVLSAQNLMLSADSNLKNHGFSASGLPLIGRFLNGTVIEADYADIDFTDVIAVEPDENGVFTIEYDITDLSSYSFTVLDKAYNSAEFTSEAVLAEAIQPGVYIGQERLLSFTADKVDIADVQNGEVKSSAYTLANGQMEIDGQSVTVERVNSQILRLIYEDGSVEKLIYHGEGTLEDYPFYTVDQIIHAVYNQIPDMADCQVEMDVHENIVEFKAYQEDTLLYYFTVDYFDAYYYNVAYGVEGYLLPLTFDDIASGVWMEVHDGEMHYMDFDNSIYIAQEDGTAQEFSYTLNNTDLVFDFGDGQKKAEDYLEDEYASLTWEDGSVSHLYSVGTSEELSFYTNEELADMAEKYYTAQNGSAPEMLEIYVDEFGYVIIELSDSEYYCISPFTGEGYDQDENEVVLTSAVSDPFSQGVWFAFSNTEDGRYYIFTDDHSGKIQYLSDGAVKEFTYSMTEDGAVFHIDGEDIYVQVSPQRDGTIIIDQEDGEYKYNALMTYLDGQDPETFSFYTLEQLAELAGADLEDIQAASDGKVSISIRNESGEVIDTYVIDPTTAEGTNEAGEDISLTSPSPELPEDAYSLDDLCDMALNDYEEKTGTRPENADAVVNRDGSVTIQLKDQDGTVDTYTVDPVTGIGTDASGKEVNLPQTGNNALGTAAAVGSALMMAVTGAYAVLRSGIFRKKNDEE